MSTTTLTMTAKEARENFSDLVNRTAFAKERVVVTRNKRQVAAVVPVEDLELRGHHPAQDPAATVRGVDADEGYPGGGKDRARNRGLEAERAG